MASQEPIPTSELLAAASLAADMDEWIIYDSGKMPIEKWLEVYRPSQITRQQGVGWICVAKPSSKDTEEPTEEEDPCGLQDSFQALLASHREVSLQTITALAQQHKVLSGKWLFHATTGLKIDYLWRLIAKATASGALGSSAKVSVVDDDNFNNSHVVCVYVNDFTNKNEVVELEAAIRKAGIKGSLAFKPDAYTYIGVYRGNPWGIRPVIYESQYSILEGRSHVTEI